MKRVLVFASIMLGFASQALANRYNCQCIETNRRLSGLYTVLDRASLSRQEYNAIQWRIQTGENYYYQVSPHSSGQEQSYYCSMANQAVDPSWVRWQPWLARHGWDIGNACEGRRPHIFDQLSEQESDALVLEQQN